MHNKGQVEMFGLVIIVLLILVIGLFSLFFITRTNDQERDVYYSLKAQNFANALSKASIDVSNMEAYVLSCCSGIGGSCDRLLEFSEDQFEKLDPGSNIDHTKLAKVELVCYDGTTYFTGKCIEGKASESIYFQSQDHLRVILCKYGLKP